MVDAGLIQRVEVHGLKETFFANPLEFGKSPEQRSVHLLSPFDNAIIQRRRIMDIFGFDYQLECYLPPTKRSYGYFCLPVLWGNQFVGRLDPKVDRKTRTFTVVNLVLDSITEDLLELLAAKIWALARFNECNKLAIQKTAPRIKGKLNQLLATVQR